MSDINQISVALIGNVSSGKSTLLNAMTTHKYSDMKLKRTTTIPQVYVESTSGFSEYKIYEKNKKKNSENSGKLDKCAEIIHSIGKFTDFIHLEKCQLRVYDLPGLNDSKAEKAYYQYLDKNFSGYDIIICVVDITSSFSTSGEMKMLEYLKNNLGGHQKIMFALNKCDNMDYAKKNYGYGLNEEYVDLIKTSEKIIKKAIPAARVFPISAEDAFIYRMYNKNPSAKLDISHLNKFGMNERGRKFLKMNDSEKRKSISRLMKSVDYDKMLIDTGFMELIKTLKQLCHEDHIIMHHLNKYISLKVITSEEDCANFVKTVEKFLELCNYSDDRDELTDILYFDDCEIYEKIKKFYAQENKTIKELIDIHNKSCKTKWNCYALLTNIIDSKLDILIKEVLVSNSLREILPTLSFLTSEKISSYKFDVVKKIVINSKKILIRRSIKIMGRDQHLEIQYFDLIRPWCVLSKFNEIVENYLILKAVRMNKFIDEHWSNQMMGCKQYIKHQLEDYYLQDAKIPILAKNSIRKYTILIRNQPRICKRINENISDYYDEVENEFDFTKTLVYYYLQIMK